MEYVTVEFYFDETKAINEAKNKIIEILSALPMKEQH